MLTNAHFYIMAITDILTIFIFLFVYSIFHRGKDEVIKEEGKPVTKLELWAAKIMKIANKIKLKVFFYLFVMGGGLVLLNKGLYAVGTSGDVTELQFMAIINTAIIFGSIIFMYPFLDKIRFFKNKKIGFSKGGASIVKEISN